MDIALLLLPWKYVLHFILMPLCFCSLTGISYIAPHLNNLYFLTLCQRYGVYQVIRWLFMLKLGLSVAMLLAGADHIYLLCIFIARYGTHTHWHMHQVTCAWRFVWLYFFFPPRSSISKLNAQQYITSAKVFTLWMQITRIGFPHNMANHHFWIKINVRKRRMRDVVEFSDYCPCFVFQNMLFWISKKQNNWSIKLLMQSCLLHLS